MVDVVFVIDIKPIIMTRFLGIATWTLLDKRYVTVITPWFRRTVSL